MTGWSPPPLGVNTFRNRQFSDVLPWPNGPATCGQCGANCVASRTPGQPAAGCGGCQRNAPTGGAAYGMPRNSSTAPLAKPRTGPLAVPATGPLPLVPATGPLPPAAACRPRVFALTAG